MYIFFFFKQKAAYEMRISDWSSDVCSSDLPDAGGPGLSGAQPDGLLQARLPQGRAAAHRFGLGAGGNQGQRIRGRDSHRLRADLREAAEGPDRKSVV